MSTQFNNRFGGCRFRPPSTRVEEGKGEGHKDEDIIEINIYARLSMRSIVFCLISIGVVTVLTLLTIRCIEHYLNG